MSGVSQLGISMGALGIVLAMMGLFPEVMGIPTGAGFGILQFVAVMIGFGLLFVGALVYVKYTFYPSQHANLVQQIGVRLALTGLVLSGISGLADFVGFGSHTRTLVQDVLLGPWQAIGIIGGFLVSSLGVLLYAVANRPE